LTRIKEKPTPTAAPKFSGVKWTQIHANKMFAPFKSAKFDQGWALDGAIAQDFTKE
jgi:hypothetical protein